jgi:hypothetical protein
VGGGPLDLLLTIGSFSTTGIEWEGPESQASAQARRCSPVTPNAPISICAVALSRAFLDHWASFRAADRDWRAFQPSDWVAYYELIVGTHLRGEGVQGRELHALIAETSASADVADRLVGVFKTGLDLLELYDQAGGPSARREDPS